MTQQEALAKVSPALANALGIAEFEVANVLKLIATASGMGGGASADDGAVNALRKDIDDLRGRIEIISAGEGADDTAVADLSDRVRKLEDQHDKLSASFKSLASGDGSTGADASGATTGSIEAPKAPEPQPVPQPPQGSILGDDSAKAVI